MKKYSVTNRGTGSICLTGLLRVEIPAHCEGHAITLPDSTAKKTVAGLKRRYPLLKIVEVKEQKAAKTDTIEDAETEASEAGTATDAEKSGSDTIAAEINGSEEQTNWDSQEG